MRRATSEADDDHVVRPVPGVEGLHAAARGGNSALDGRHRVGRAPTRKRLGCRPQRQPSGTDRHLPAELDDAGIRRGGGDVIVTAATAAAAASHDVLAASGVEPASFTAQRRRRRRRRWSASESSPAESWRDAQSVRLSTPAAAGAAATVGWS